MARHVKGVLGPGNLDPLTLDLNLTGQAYDVIHTSNLCDSLGTLNVMIGASPLLKQTPHATIYTVYLTSAMPKLGPVDNFVQRVTGMDTISASLLLGVVPIDW